MNTTTKIRKTTTSTVVTMVCKAFEHDSEPVEHRILVDSLGVRVLDAEANYFTFNHALSNEDWRRAFDLATANR